MVGKYEAIAGGIASEYFGVQEEEEAAEEGEEKKKAGKG
jgi:hypothetical protein